MKHPKRGLGLRVLPTNSIQKTKIDERCGSPDPLEKKKEDVLYTLFSGRGKETLKIFFGLCSNRQPHCSGVHIGTDILKERGEESRPGGQKTIRQTGGNEHLVENLPTIFFSVSGKGKEGPIEWEGSKRSTLNLVLGQKGDHPASSQLEKNVKVGERTNRGVKQLNSSWLLGKPTKKTKPTGNVWGTLT